MGHRLLFVCHANVCRSPLMAATFSAGVAANGDAAAWEIESAGVGATRGALCPVSGEFIDEVLTPDASATLRATFAPKQPAERWLDTAGIIIAATREERGALAHIDPALRPHTFTLREAVALGGPHLDETEREAAHAAGWSLASYAAMLNDRRGLVEIPPVRRGFSLSRRAVDPSDLQDVHHLAPRMHRSGLIDVRDAAAEFADQVIAYVQTGA